MRSYVFTDAELTKHAGRFVWLSIDAEKEVNAAFLEKYPLAAYPTLLFIDSDTGSLAFKWVGSANARQLERLLDDGQRALHGEGAAPEFLALTRADRLYADRRPEDAAIAYREAIAAAEPTWPARARAVESLITALTDSQEPEACATAAAGLAPGLPRGASFANAVVLGLACALGADEQAPWRKAALAKLEPLAHEAVALPGLLADDRSGLYEELADCAEARGDAAAEKQAVLNWLDFLEGEASRAPTPEARAVFDPHRVVASIRAQDPLRALPALQRSEKELPGDYNPPARLALLFQKLGRFNEALSATDRALSKAYGPRKVRVFEIRAGIHLEKGDPAAARQTFQEALAFARKLPAAQHPERAVRRLEAALAKVPKP